MLFRPIDRTPLPRVVLTVEFWQGTSYRGVRRWWGDGEISGWR